MTTTTAPAHAQPRTGRGKAETAFSILVGLTTLGILIQSLMAGVFLQADGNRDAYATWISAHGVGADVTSVLALAATVVAFGGLRARRSLWIGSGALFVLLLLESLLGHLINGSIGGSEHDGLTIVHIPLGMLLIAVTAWLAFQARVLRVDDRG